MAKFTEMDNRTCGEIERAVVLQLEGYCTAHGLIMKIGGGRFDTRAGTYKPRLEFALAEVNGMPAEQAQFLALCVGAGVSQQAWGKKFALHHGQNEFTVCGIRPRSRTHKLVAKGSRDGKRYKFDPKVLGRACPNCKLHGGCACRLSEQVMAQTSAIIDAADKNELK